MLFWRHARLLPLILLYHRGAVGTELRITSLKDFTTFINNVNRGSTYTGTTVYLDNDLSLSDATINPIGKDDSNYFSGTFDGQGYVISDLKMSYSSEYTGLFGYSTGLTIKNIVLGPSCTITNTYTGSNDVYAGGFIGWCYGSNGQCNIESSVNMAAVTFGGTVSSNHPYLHLGGFAGKLYSLKYESHTKSCGNYGSVTHSGTNDYNSYIGGIAGILFSSGSSYTYLQNCLNHGTITHSGTSSNELRVGGITGYSGYTYIVNSVSAGKITTQNAPSSSHIGGIVGYVDSKLYINYCYYTSGIGVSGIYGYADSTPSTTGSSTSAATVDSTLISSLNTYASDNSWNKWLLNSNSAEISFKMNDNRSFSLSSSLVVLPDLASGWRSFAGWFTDSLFATALSSYSTSIGITLYGRWDKYTVTFDGNGGSTSETSRNVAYNNAYGTLPEANRNGYKFNGWFTEKTGGTEVTSSSKLTSPFDHTIYARWATTSYTLRFIFGNGIDDVVRTLNYNDAVTYPDNPTREGYTFNGWDKSDIESMPGYDLNITAQWTINSYTLRFIFNNGTDDAVRAINFNGDVTYPDDPTREGHTFNGWDKSDVKLMPAYNLNITAQWAITSYMLRFIFGNGIDDVVRTLNYNDAVTYPDNPTREGYTFNGWDKNNIESMPGYDLNITAQWTANSYVVTFDVNGGDELSTASITVSFNSAYGDLPKPTRNEASFVAWVTDANDNVTSKTTVQAARNHTLYARWIVNKYTLTFNFSNGSDPEVRTVEFNSTICYPKDQTKEGYTFNGWDKSNIEFMPGYDLNITAQWTINNYTLRFIFGNGTEDVVKIVNFNDAVDYPDDPIKDGSTFNGWDKSDIAFMPGYDLNITARWIDHCYILRFIFNNGTDDVIRTISYNDAVTYPDNPTKEGYTFNGWDKSDVKLMPTHDLNITAQWAINSYTLIFDFDNGTTLESVHKFSEEIVYPENVIREGYIFSGWDSTAKYIPAKNFTITALWVKKSTISSSSPFPFSIALAMGVGVPIFVIIIAICFAIFVFVRKKHKNDPSDGKFEMDKPLIDKNSPFSGHSRVVATATDEVEGNAPVKASKLVLSHLYTRGYVRPSMLDALTEVGLSINKVKTICSACENAAGIVADEGKLFDGFTKDDAAAIAMYTYDFGSKELENNPYRIINKSLVERNYAGLQRASGLLYLVMTGLRKLPRVTGSTLYRGVRNQVNLDKDHYTKGNTITWSALSSTSPNLETTKTFLAKGSKSGKAVGTLFIIDDGWGYDIQPYSLFPDEAEILLEPERQFEVVSVVPLSGITVIYLRMVDTPLVLPEVFNDGCV